MNAKISALSSGKFGLDKSGTSEGLLRRLKILKIRLTTS